MKGRGLAYDEAGSKSAPLVVTGVPGNDSGSIIASIVLTVLLNLILNRLN